jgi:hypothetical protein
MFPRNTAGHHKAHTKDEIQKGTQTSEKRTARFSVQVLLPDMSGGPTGHVREAIENQNKTRTCSSYWTYPRCTEQHKATTGEESKGLPNGVQMTSKFNNNL